MSAFAMPISANDDLNSNANPLFVTNTTPVEVVTKVCVYKKTTVAGNNTIDNHDYTVVGSKMRLHRVRLSSQSKFECEVQIGPIATLVTKAMGQVNTSQMANEVIFDPWIDVPAGQIVRVIRRRTQSGSDDVATTIMGEDIA